MGVFALMFGRIRFLKLIDCSSVSHHGWAVSYDKWSQLEMTPGYLRELARDHTQPEIAGMLGVAELTVRRWMHKHGVAALQVYERRILDSTGLTLNDLTPAILRVLYEERLLTDAEIGAKYGVAKTPIRLRRHEYGIPAISKAERNLRRGIPATPVKLAKPSSPAQVPPVASERKTKPKVACAWKGCRKKFVSENGARYCSEACLKEVDADRARRRREANKQLGPIRRTFVCHDPACGRSWETDEPGNWRLCPECRAGEDRKLLEAENVKRTKRCAYESCGQSFVDDSPKNGRKFCSPQCVGRAKRLRAGVVASDDQFLANQERTCAKCDGPFTPLKLHQRFCSRRCREEQDAVDAESRRDKVCVHCNLAFRDTSLKNNMRAHPECSRVKWGHLGDPSRELENSPTREEARRHRVRWGDGGRIDDIRTLAKYTNTWWGRVSELLFAAYRTDAKDVNVEHGNRCPYDFEDPELGRVNVRGGRTTTSPEGRPMWFFSTAGLRDGCNHAFLVGYSLDRTLVEHLWLVPAAHLSASGMRMAPGSREYVAAQWEVSDAWGLGKANLLLEELRALPDPVRPTDRFAWLDDASNLNDHAPGHKGRRGEMLYQVLHPDSRDMNREQGSTAPYDFTDTDGSKVNVKTSRRNRKAHSRLVRWSFGRGVHEKEHRCDVYVCLCLAEDGVSILREYRIPVEVWGDRRTIHIYENDGHWAEYKEGR